MFLFLKLIQCPNKYYEIRSYFNINKFRTLTVLYQTNFFSGWHNQNKTDCVDISKNFEEIEFEGLAIFSKNFTCCQEFLTHYSSLKIYKFSS